MAEDANINPNPPSRAAAGSARSWTIDWTQRNGMQRTGHASTDMGLVAMLADILERSEPRKITLKPNSMFGPKSPAR